MVSRNKLTNDFHIDKSRYRHWSPRSESFTGCDALLTALAQGWSISGSLIFCQQFWQGSGRCVRVFHFDLERGQDMQRMRVVWNPVVDQLVMSLPMRVVVMNERKDITTEVQRVLVNS